MLITEEEYLAHYGVIRRSGRYPWGSGENENTHNRNLLDYISEMKSQGLSDALIAKGLHMSQKEYRAEKSIARHHQRQKDITEAQKLKDKGYSNVAIGEKMGKNESSVRALLATGAADKSDNLQATAKMLREEVDKHGFIDIGSGVENSTGVSRTMMDTAVQVLNNEGYETHYLKLQQVSTGQYTNMKVLGTPGSKQREIFLDPTKIKHIEQFSDDHGRNFYGLHPPLQINPKRVDVVFAEDGGGDADGMIYVRRGVKDVELGGKNYAQVRVAVGKNHYLKGMAMYKDDLPDGVDVQFHTSKKKSDSPNKLDAMKEIKADEDNPFGSMVRQIVDNKGTPNEKVTSAMNIVNEEGNWNEWSRNLSSQMLSKQSPALAKTQLDMTHEQRQMKLKGIQDLTNAAVRKKLLNEFAEETASASVHLKAAALPRQGVHVILPISTLPPTQVYAPSFLHGEKVVLIRHPHGGTFEIPELTVNNNHAESKRLLGSSKTIDAIGINHEVARRLSGADFDGDTVLVIPNNQRHVNTTAAIKELMNFDPRATYPKYEGMKVMSNTQTEMGLISNLITDMSIKGAPINHITRAVKHSMVVIDAEKHELNYKQSYDDNGIKELKQKYQGSAKGGAATLLSRARSPEYVPQRKLRSYKEGGPVDKVTGEIRYEPTNKVNFRTGKPRTTKSTKIAETTDARTLMSTTSGTQMERLYADHSNKLKKMSNQARLEAENTPRSVWVPSAKKTYAKQVEELDAALFVAKKARPLERQAQIIASSRIKAKRNDDPNMDEDTLNKIKMLSLEQARVETGSKKAQIKISQEQWDAIQAGAISDHKLTEILSNADMEIVKKLATPHEVYLMTPAKTKRAASMLASGATRADVAKALGVSLSTLDEATNG